MRTIKSEKSLEIRLGPVVTAVVVCVAVAFKARLMAEAAAALELR